MGIPMGIPIGIPTSKLVKIPAKNPVKIPDFWDPKSVPKWSHTYSEHVLKMSGIVPQKNPKTKKVSQQDPNPPPGGGR